MNIIFSNTIFFLQKKGGISRYFVNLVRELKKIKVKCKIIAPISKNLYLKSFQQDQISFYVSRFPNNYLIKKINDLLFSWLLRKENPDIIHETYYNRSNLNILKNKIKVLTIYDLVHESFSKFYPKKKLLEKKNILKYIDHFICISKKTQNDFTKYYKIPKKKTSVIYLGCDHLKKNIKKKYDLNLSNFFLYVGSREGYKNFKILIDAINSSEKLKKIKVVCFGGGKFSHEEIKKFKSKNNFVNLQGDDTMLAYLYTRAVALVNTSRYEGFGITNIEAMHLGCPVISSDFITMREIGSNACLYFKNNTSYALANKLELLLYNNELRKTFVKRGYERSKLFTWAKSAKKTKDLYGRLLNKNQNR